MRLSHSAIVYGRGPQAVGGWTNTRTYAEVYQDVTPIDADLVYVQRIDARTWEVWTGEGEATAYCTSNGQYYEMPLRFRIVASLDQPM